MCITFLQSRYIGDSRERTILLFDIRDKEALKTGMLEEESLNKLVIWVVLVSDSIHV